jgi:hypothetical protein
MPTPSNYPFILGERRQAQETEEHGMELQIWREGHYADIGKTVLRLLQALSYLTCETMMKVNDKLSAVCRLCITQ